MNPEDRRRVLNDPWMKEFIKEQKQLTDIITAYYKDKLDLPVNKIMCYLFMKTETFIMDEVCKLIDKDNIITRVHDGVYTKSPLLIKVKEDLRYLLGSISSELVLEEEQNTAWYNKLLADNIEYEHKQHMRREYKQLEVLQSET